MFKILQIAGLAIELLAKGWEKYQNGRKQKAEADAAARNAAPFECLGKKEEPNKRNPNPICTKQCAFCQYKEESKEKEPIITENA